MNREKKYSSTSSWAMRQRRFCTKETLNNNPTYVYNDAYYNIENGVFEDLIKDHSLSHDIETKFKYTLECYKEKSWALDYTK